MRSLLARQWYVMGLRGAAAVLFGGAALLWPSVTVKGLVVLFGVYALVDGVLALGTALGGSARKEREVLGLEGLFSVVAGGAALAWPEVTPRVLLFILAAWAVATGITEVTGAVRLRRELDQEWLLAWSGAASVFAGLVLALRPTAAVGAIAWLIGGYAVGFGGLLIGLASRLRVARDTGTPGQPDGSPTGGSGQDESDESDESKGDSSELEPAAPER